MIQYAYLLDLVKNPNVVAVKERKSEGNECRRADKINIEPSALQQAENNQSLG